MKILVIDDKAKDERHPRTRLLDVLRKREPIEVDLIEPLDAQLMPKLNKIAEYNLILVDYKFDTAASPIFKTGASLYSLLRDYTKSIPIYLISVLSSKNNQFGEFELFIKDEFIEDFSSFKRELEDHEKLKSVTSPEHFKEILGVPAEIEDDFFSLIKPLLHTQHSIGEDVNQSSETLPSNSSENTNIRLFRWLVRSFLNKEGPLLSKEGAALHLGISTDYFDKISSTFKSAKYKGVFWQSLEARWWLCLLEDYILDLDENRNLLSEQNFKKAAAELLNANEHIEFSTCIVCEKLFPDALGIISGDEDKKLYPAHIACSEFNESIEQEAFFKNPRIIKAD